MPRIRTLVVVLAGDIALVGLRAAVEPGAELPGGARFPAVEE